MPWLTASDELPLDHRGPTDTPFEPFEGFWLERPLIERFQEMVARYGDKISVDDGVLRLTYNELLSASLRLARVIEPIVPAGRPVGIVLPNNASFPVAALACLAIGRPFVPIDCNYPTTRNLQIIGEAGVAALIVDGAGGAREMATSLPRLDIGTALAASGDTHVDIAPSEGPAVILYTSGSTGGPKGICNDQRAILQRVAQAVNSCHLNSNDRFVLLSSPGTIAGVRETFAALLNGSTLYIADPHRLGMQGVLRVFGSAGITVGYAVPALLRQLLNLPGAQQAFSSARIIRTGGDIPLESDLALCRAVLPPSCHLLIAFSSTEIPTIFQWFVPHDWVAETLRLPVGQARPGVSFMLVDDCGAPVREGEAGELVVKSPYLALGLWQRGQLQRGPFLDDPSDSRARILHTGDLVRLRPDGLSEMMGRKDRQIKIRGLLVHPVEAEAVLRGCQGVLEATVIVRRQGEEARQLVAYVVPREQGTAGLTAELKRALASRLPQHMRPSQIHFLAAIPLLPGFKPDIRALEAIDQTELAKQDEIARSDRQPDPGPGLPAGSSAACDVRNAVRRAWVAVLNRKSFEDDVPWEDAGGDSLNALQLWFGIEHALRRPCPLDTLQNHTTPSELIRDIAQKLELSQRQTDHVDAPERPLVFFMPAAEGDAPAYARFRAALRGSIQFECIEYPRWKEMMDGGAGFDVIVDASVKQIIANCGRSSCLLAGFSFGGFVAWETAHRLTQLGRQVGFVGLIDTRRQQQVRKAESRIGWVRRKIRETWQQPRSAYAEVRWRIIYPLVVRVCPAWLLRDIGELTSRWPATFGLSWRLMMRLRLLSLDKWVPKPLHVPAYLFRSDEFLPDAPDFNWGSLCEQLQVIPVTGSHVTLFEPPSLDILCRRFLQAVQAAAAEPPHSVEGDGPVVTQQEKRESVTEGSPTAS